MPIGTIKPFEDAVFRLRDLRRCKDERIGNDRDTAATRFWELQGLHDFGDATLEITIIPSATEVKRRADPATSTPIPFWLRRRVRWATGCRQNTRSGLEAGSPLIRARELRWAVGLTTWRSNC